MRDDADPDRTSRMEDGFDKAIAQAREQQTASLTGASPAGAELDRDYLAMVKLARPKLKNYWLENLSAKVDASYNAFRNTHFRDSKYWHQEYRHRSKLFRPKTRTAVRKAGAAAVSALFASDDAVKCSAGNQSDPAQRANAALIQELFNYRTDRTSGQAALPWFRICGGAHQQGMIESACVSKQYWKLELRHMGTEAQKHEETGEDVLDDETGEPVQQDVYKPFIDRPDCLLIPMENIEIDPAANWLSPIQSAAVFIAKFPMSIDEVMQMAEHPLSPWESYTEAQLRSWASSPDMNSQAARQSRDGGTDRYDRRYTSSDFDVIWVYEVFIRAGGRDICFFAAQDQAYLTQPKPVHEVYPEQGGERPYTFGVVNLEAHRLFPMSPVESWQQTQIEINDFANLILDTAKLTVSPIKKVVRGAQVDLAALNRLGPNGQVLVTKDTDVTFEKPPGVTSDSFAVMERLNNDFDTAAGNFDQSTVQSSRAVGNTVGGLQLVSGAANAVAEFDQRVWIETWVEPTIAQLIKCIQYYEHDETILALCGDKAQLLEKFKVSEIDDELLTKQVTVRVDAGVGNGDPQQRMQKISAAIQTVAPLFKDNPDVASGAIKINVKAISDEVFSIAGYRDGADRFIIVGQPQQNPNAGLEAAKVQSEIEKNKKQGSAAMVTALAAAAKVDLTDKQLEQQRANDEIDQHLRGTELGHGHGLALRQHADGQANVAADRQQSQDQFDATQASGDGDDEGAGAAPPATAPAPSDNDDDEGQGAPLVSQLIQLLRQPRQRAFTVQRGPDGRISGVTEISSNGEGGGGPAPPPQSPQAPPPPPFDQSAQPLSGGFVV